MPVARAVASNSKANGGAQRTLGRSCKNCTQSTGLLDAKSVNKCCASFSKARLRNSVVSGEAGIADTAQQEDSAIEKTDAGQAGVCHTRALSYVMMTGPWRTCATKCCPWRCDGRGEFQLHTCHNQMLKCFERGHWTFWQTFHVHQQMIRQTAQSSAQKRCVSFKPQVGTSGQGEAPSLVPGKQTELVQRMPKRTEEHSPAAFAREDAELLAE